jgi:hypothetical protein
MTQADERVGHGGRGDLRIGLAGRGHSIDPPLSQATALRRRASHDERCVDTGLATKRGFPHFITIMIAEHLAEKLAAAL